jgi:putative transcriptional regulator
MAMKVTAKKSGGPKRGYLDGQMLIAMPTMRDERFARSLIYVCAHSSEGAMGIVVNQPAGNIKFPDLLVQLDVIPAKDLIQLPPQGRHREGAQGRTGRDRARLRAALGGFLHREFDAADRQRHLPHRDARYPEGDRARRRPAKRGAGARLCGLGAGAAGERDQENGWLNCDADSELIFGSDVEGKYDQGVHRLAEGKALRVFAAELIELDRIGIGLGALGDHVHAEIVRERDDRAQDHRPRARLVVRTNDWSILMVSNGKRCR